MNPQHSQHIPNPCPPALLPAPSGPPRAVSAVPAESPSIAHRIAHCTRSSSAFGEKTEPRPILPRIYSRIDCQRRPPAHLHGGGGCLTFSTSRLIYDKASVPSSTRLLSKPQIQLGQPFGLTTE